MTFVNKKEDVVQISLTQHGKNLLSRGAFKPVFYQFFDDDVIYDHKYAGCTETQNEITDRIETNIRLSNQHVVTSIEDRFDDETEKIEQGQRDIFLPITKILNEIEREKLLSFPISNMSTGIQNTPSFNLSSFDCKIQNSSSVTHLTQSGFPAKIPQIDFNPVYYLEKNTINKQDDDGSLVNEEEYRVDFSETKIEFIDKTFLQLKPEDVVLLLEENNVPFTKENFKIEVYEIFDDNSASIINDVNEIFELFEIEVDESVKEIPNEKNINKNFFSK